MKLIPLIFKPKGNVEMATSRTVSSRLFINITANMDYLYIIFRSDIQPSRANHNANKLKGTLTLFHPLVKGLTIETTKNIYFK